MLACLIATFLLVESDSSWRFVLPAPGNAFEHPPLRLVSLGTEKPDDLVEKVAYRGRRRRYGQLRYGSPSSVRVTVVLDEVAPGDVDLYVDADRNRRIEPGDELANEEHTWRLPLDVERIEGEATTHERRAAVFKLGSTGLTFSHAAAGYLDGKARIGERSHAARRVDGDGNGRLTDAQDRLWIDLDDDGRFDPVDEQFPFSTILTLGGSRYAARSDEFGHRLALEPLEGAGTVRLALEKPADAVAELSVTLIGRDGSVFGLSGFGSEATLPIGDYRVGTVTLTLDDPSGGPRWSYVFSDNGRRGEGVWYQVARDRTVAIDPIGKLTLDAGLAGPGSHPLGDDLTVSPGLYTGDGLLIVTCYRGTPTTPGGDSGPGAEIVLTTGDGRVLSGARSGFA